VYQPRESLRGVVHRVRIESRDSRGAHSSTEILVWTLSSPVARREVRYVALVLAPTLEHRVGQHVAGEIPRTRGWVLELRAAGLEPVAEIVERVPTRGPDFRRAQRRLTAWIDRLRADGHDLL
jgi:hypothetical protein